jgi:branched-chain amino acid transport system substrate-binding protein
MTLVRGKKADEVPMTRSRLLVLAAAVTSLFAGGDRAVAQNRYAPGASDGEIKFGQTMSYSGPNTAFAVLGKVADGYFRKLNDEGGINGRKLKFLSYDDAFNPAKTVEQTRKLVESDEVLFTFGSLGTSLQLAVQKYLNAKGVPQLFVLGPSSRWEDYKNFPWTIGITPSYRREGRIYAKFVLKQAPEGRIAILYQNDEYGRDLLKGVKEGLGDKVSMIVSEESFEISETTMDTHVLKLKASGADVFIDITPPKFAAQAIRKVSEIGWKPLHIMNRAGNSIGSVLRVAGLQNSQGLVSVAWNKDASDPRWSEDLATRQYREFLEKYVPSVNADDGFAPDTYNWAQLLAQVLKQCGDDLTRENIMKQATNIRDFTPTMLLPGLKINTSPTDYAPMKDLQMVRFEDDRWIPFGNVVNGD